MGVASLVLGIVTIVLTFIPFCGYIIIIPAIVGLALGAIDAVQKNKAQEPKGMAIAGVVLNIIAIVVYIGKFVIIFGMLGAAAL